MEINPECPVCAARQWEIIGERRYLLSDLPNLSEYVRRRYRVLFEQWAIGQDAVDCKSAMCSSCGFVSNIPRPNEEEIDAKYKLLAALGQDYGARESLPVQRRRARGLYSFLKPWIRPDAKILDFGGGDGRLMSVFAKLRHECLVVDYNDSPQRYVRKLGDTIDQLPAGFKVDVIVCSHVIEHVAAPVGVLRALADHLTRPGVLFVEVPMEIWRRAPLHVEPVTHVNFFVPGTLDRCVAAAGLNVIHCQLVSSLHPNGTAKAAIRLLADNRRSPRPRSGVTSEVRTFLNPRWRDRLWYLSTIRPYLRAALSRRSAQVLSRVRRATIGR